MAASVDAATFFYCIGNSYTIKKGTGFLRSQKPSKDALMILSFFNDEFRINWCHFWNNANFTFVTSFYSFD